MKRGLFLARMKRKVGLLVPRPTDTASVEAPGDTETAVDRALACRVGLRIVWRNALTAFHVKRRRTTHS